MVAKTDIRTKRRKQIFEAATRVVGEKGFHDATIREIAREAGLGKGTIYQYIRKKEDLISLIAEEGVALLAEKLEEASVSSEPREKQLEKTIDVILDLLQEHSMLAKTMAFEMQTNRHEDISRIQDIFEQKFLLRIRDQIREIISRDRFLQTDEMILTDVLMMMCFSWAHVDLLQKHADGIETYKRVLTNLFLYGLTDKNREAADG